MSQPSSLYDTAALRRIEVQAAALLDGDHVLMQRAGLAGWRGVLAHWPQVQRLVVVCGPGNNGGDGYVLARHAHQAGREVRVLRLPTHAPRTELARRMEQEYQAAGGRVDVFDHTLAETDLIVDAMFGIGLSRAPDAEVAALMTVINDATWPVFALDAPSGVDTDTGEVRGEAIRATRTLQFIAAHVGLATGAALDHVGICDVAALDLPADLLATMPPAAHALFADDVDTFLKPRHRNAHKGQSGRVLCIGGDHGKGGAIVLCTEAALRSGAGLVDVATRTSHVPALLARRPEAMAHGVDAADAMRDVLAAADVVAIGPGLGQETWGKSLYDAAIDCGKTCIIDADALNVLATAPRLLPANCILTPHPGEAARLLGIATRDVQADRRAAAHTLCERYGGVVVLKGAGTVVAARGQTPRIICAGNPGMAVGGMGDVLTGVIAALCAQGLPSFEAAMCGALLHAAAGDAAARDGGERGLLPSDMFVHLRRLANP